MAWNEPGGGNKDPWSGKSGGDQGPPDLDEVVRKLQERLGGLFGGNRAPGDGSSGGGRFGVAGGQFSPKIIGVIIGILLVIWLATGIYIVEPAERGVVMRFGRYTDTTSPGPHWHLPIPIESVVKVNVDEVSTLTHKAAMLTQDENIVEVELTVQSRIQDAGGLSVPGPGSRAHPKRRDRDRGARHDRSEPARLCDDRGPRRGCHHH